MCQPGSPRNCSCWYTTWMRLVKWFIFYYIYYLIFILPISKKSGLTAGQDDWIRFWFIIFILWPACVSARMSQEWSLHVYQCIRGYGSLDCEMMRFLLHLLDFCTHKSKKIRPGGRTQLDFRWMEVKFLIKMCIFTEIGREIRQKNSASRPKKYTQNANVRGAAWHPTHS
jgi:hypothetical protein